MSKTVFVIGAGASVEFGEQMPVGSALATMIRECLTAELANHRRGGDTPIIDALSRSGFHGQHEEAMRRIRDGITTKESIDDFVDEWKDVPFLPEVAKASISYCIASSESATKLAELSPPGTNFPALGRLERPMTGNAPDRAGILANLRNTWLGCILRYHNGRARRRSFLDAIQDTSFVVFNYDRCIEQYLWHNLTTSLAVPPAEAREVLLSVPILQAFGSIGQLPELGGHHPFGSHDPSHIYASATQIRTYTESAEGFVGDRIASVISSAEKLVFRGCAYHEQNLDLLFPNGPNGIADLWGTCFGIRPRKLEELNSYFEPLARTMPNLVGATAGEMLEKYRDELF